MSELDIQKSGYVAIIGRPNVGKSTLLNVLVHEKISITSAKPQTTRWQILGIQTLPHAQIIYIDTPGLHQDEKRAMNRYMNRVANAVIADADVIMFMMDALHWRHEDELVVEKLQRLDDKKPVILVINKIDLLPDRATLLPFITKLQSKFDFAAIVPISATKADNIDGLEQSIIDLLPAGPMLFPSDQRTDKSVRFQVAEIIREKLIQTTAQELPYATTVEIEQFKVKETEAVKDETVLANKTKEIMEISAIIWVERPGQKIIIIGKEGAKLKKIGTQARREIEKLLGTKVFLRLWVKVKENWTDDERALRGLGYE
ncbi:MAG TPA: GTPase Era [Gammaproteobacteria bacterium]|nr:GTPase Era [Gammaproteobacteria bacterium]